MDEKLQAALDNTDDIYQDLVEIASKVVECYTSDVNKLIRETTENVDNLSTEDIRTIMLKISLNAFTLGDVKEKSSLKAECAETLRKEAYATAFATAEGSVAAKENAATVSSSKESAVELIYSTAAGMLKTKLDECHRVVDALKTVIMSRAAEAKLTANLYDGEGQ